MYQKETPKDQMVALPNGKEAINLAPESNSQLAIVHLAVVKRLARLLPKADFAEIRDQFIYDLQASDSLEAMVDIARSEVEFHETVNLITLLGEESAVSRPAGSNMMP